MPQSSLLIPPSISASLRFVIRHWWHLLLGIPGVILFTTLHEAAHGAAVLLQGGTIHNFVVLPQNGNWGYIESSFPIDAIFSPFLISIAPYLLWLAGFTYIWLFVIPLTDIANATIPWILYDKQNDFSEAWGTANWIAIPVLVLSISIAAIVGYWVQRRLYQKQSLPRVSYALLFMVSLVGVLVMTCEVI